MASDQRSRGHLVRKKRSPRRHTPRDDPGINTFIIVFSGILLVTSARGEDICSAIVSGGASDRGVA